MARAGNRRGRGSRLELLAVAGGFDRRVTVHQLPARVPAHPDVGEDERVAEVGAGEARGLAVARVQDRRVAEDVEVDLLEREVVDLVRACRLLEPILARPAPAGAADELELAPDQPLEP